MAVSNTALSVIVAIAIIGSVCVSICIVFSWASFNTDSGSGLIISIGEKRAPSCAFLGQVISKFVEGRAVAEINAAIVIITGPSVG